MPDEELSLEGKTQKTLLVSGGKCCSATTAPSHHLTCLLGVFACFLAKTLAEIPRWAAPFECDPMLWTVHVATLSPACSLCCAMKAPPVLPSKVFPMKMGGRSFRGLSSTWSTSGPSLQSLPPTGFILEIILELKVLVELSIQKDLFSLSLLKSFQGFFYLKVNKGIYIFLKSLLLQSVSIFYVIVIKINSLYRKMSHADKLERERLRVCLNAGSWTHACN